MFKVYLELVKLVGILVLDKLLSCCHKLLSTLNKLLPVVNQLAERTIITN